MPKRLRVMLNKLPNPGSPEVLGLFPNSKGSGSSKDVVDSVNSKTSTFGSNTKRNVTRMSDAGSAARFFYCAKSSKAERGRGNNHPTVKPLALIQYLCRLVTPPGGTILDPFFGSGTLGVAAYKEKFIFIGIEQGIKNCEISKARIEQETKQFKLPMVEV